MQASRDHGGNLDAAIARFGGARSGWIDLSTGINPVPYPIPDMRPEVWTALPDQSASQQLIDVARAFWCVSNGLSILPVPGASSAIAHIPHLSAAGRVTIPGPTYNEHAASFAQAGWQVTDRAQDAQASVHVHPNNPDGRRWQLGDLVGDLCIIDESFCDVAPDASLIAEASPNTLILKSFGKFWGLAGLRLGFVIGDTAMLAKLAAMLGPWPVAGPALAIGTCALRDTDWADKTRARLTRDAARIDNIFINAGADVVGGTTLFRLYEVDNAAQWQERLAQHHIWSRIFPYNSKWIRLGLPDKNGWARLELALS